MKYLQKLGKSLLLPIAVLPICGIMMGFGYALCPSVMQGGDMHGVLNMIGFFLVKAGSALIDHIALIFAVGIAVGMSDDRDGTASLAGLVSWLMITTLLNQTTVTTMLPSIANDSIRVLAFSKIENAFIGILCGIIGSTAYNRYRDIRLPDFLAFFSGKRFVAIATAGFSIVAAMVLLVVWPIIFAALVAIGQGIARMGYIGAGLYAFLNRLLIPTGLHHALNNVFWFDTIGLGDLSHFWAGHTSADVSWDLGIYMSGFFVPMMFGIPGAALAMVRNAKTKNRKRAIGILGAAALCSFICGVTEPFEFAFMFVSFPLYVVYAVLYGLFTVLACVVGFRAGFCFSGGLADLIFSASLPAAHNTWAILWMGPLAFVVFFVVFDIVIRTFDLKTVGREDEERVEETPLSVKSGDEALEAMALAILTHVGGKENVIDVDYCATRLRFELNDTSLMDEAALRNDGALGVFKLGKTSAQVVIGTKVPFVYEMMKPYL